MCGICCICCLSGISSDKPCSYLDKDYIQSNSSIGRRGPDVRKATRMTLWSRIPALFAGFVLHLRGTVPTAQPVCNDDGDCLLWNGEIFDGMQVDDDANDTQVLFSHLTRCSSPKEILAVLQSIQGPWAFIYWQAKQERLWFGRDVLGRRSLLWHIPQGDGDDVFALSSIPVGASVLDYSEVPSVGIFCLELRQHADPPVNPQHHIPSVPHPDISPSHDPLLNVHLYPWQGATWPGTDQVAASTNTEGVLEKFGLENNAYISVFVDTDSCVPSWMPVVNRETPEENSLGDVAGHTQGGGDLTQVLRELERTGQWRELVAQLEHVLQAAVRKRVHNLPRSSASGAVLASQDCTGCCTAFCCHRLCHATCHLSDHASCQLSDHASCDMSDHASCRPPDHVLCDDVTNSCALADGMHDSVKEKLNCLSLISEPDCVKLSVHLDVKSSGHSIQQDSIARHSSQGDGDNSVSHSLCTSGTVGPSKGDAPPPSGEKLSERAKAQGVSSETDQATSEGREGCEDVQSFSRLAGDGNEFPGLTRTNLPARVAILFSGGVDSTVLAALADRCVPAEESIDLINVAFEQKVSTPQGKKAKSSQKGPIESGSSYNVPDRQTGYLALSELNPNRQWNFIEVNVSQAMLQAERSRHVRHLVYPLKTVLDDSIGCAVWFAARGRGVLGNGAYCRPLYTSTAKVILCGMGADEQLAGYSRHRVRFQQASWAGLVDEIDMEIHRISARNLGRDDRIIADHGKESRFPFLDENVVAFLASLPVHLKADLRLPRGAGEKLLLRLLALQLNLPSTAVLPKRAIQFGSRIAKLEQSKEKGADVCQRLTQQD